MRATVTTSVDPHTLSGDAKERLIDELYAVQCEVFDGVDRSRFAKYVVNSPADRTWLDVSRTPDGAAVAYIAVHRFDRTFDGKRTAVFRAEAGTVRAFRGKTPLGPAFIRAIVPALLRRPLQPNWYMGSLVHPSHAAFSKPSTRHSTGHSSDTPRQRWSRATSGCGSTLRSRWR